MVGDKAAYWHQLFFRGMPVVLITSFAAVIELLSSMIIQLFFFFFHSCIVHIHLV